MYLAAGTILDVPPTSIVSVAATAGYAGVGLRVDPTNLDSRSRALIRQQLSDTGVSMLDVEVIRLQPGRPIEAHRALVELAGELGARWVTTVSHLPGTAETAAALAQVAAMAAEVGVGVALEFMRFTEVCDMWAAVKLVREVNSQNLRVLVDPLHLARTGERLDAVAALSERDVAFVQLCDAPETAPTDLTGLVEEARHRRLLPGDGELDLASFLRSIPAGVPVSVEVQSDDLTRRFDPAKRAALSLRCACAVWDATWSTSHHRSEEPRR